MSRARPDLDLAPPPDRVDYRLTLTQVILDSALRAGLNRLPRAALLKGLEALELPAHEDALAQLTHDVDGLARAPYVLVPGDPPVFRDPLAIWLDNASRLALDRHEAHLLATTAGLLKGKVPVWTPPETVGSRLPMLLAALAVLSIAVFLSWPRVPLFPDDVDLGPAWSRAEEGWRFEQIDVPGARFLLAVPTPATAWVFGLSTFLERDGTPVFIEQVLGPRARRRWIRDRSIQDLVCVGIASVEGEIEEEEALAQRRAYACETELGPRLRSHQRMWTLNLGRYRRVGPTPTTDVRFPIISRSRGTAWQRPLLVAARLAGDGDLGAQLRLALEDPRAQRMLGFRASDYSTFELVARPVHRVDTL
ncbi:MAG: hypothetical protein H6706_04265 [Myxococcales bacterium]|nr:hypothetical protein [Myxococcales bacterium]